MLRTLTRKVQGVQPVSIGEGGLGQDDIVLVLPKLGARVLQGFRVIEHQGQFREHSRNLAGVIMASRYEQNPAFHNALSNS